MQIVITDMLIYAKAGLQWSPPPGGGYFRRSCTNGLGAIVICAHPDIEAMLCEIHRAAQFEPALSRLMLAPFAGEAVVKTMIRRMGGVSDDLALTKLRPVAAAEIMKLAESASGAPLAPKVIIHQPDAVTQALLDTLATLDIQAVAREVFSKYVLPISTSKAAHRKSKQRALAKGRMDPELAKIARLAVAVLGRATPTEDVTKKAATGASHGKTKQRPTTPLSPAGGPARSVDRHRPGGAQPRPEEIIRMAAGRP